MENVLTTYCMYSQYTKCKSTLIKCHTVVIKIFNNILHCMKKFFEDIFSRYRACTSGFSGLLLQHWFKSWKFCWKRKKIFLIKLKILKLLLLFSTPLTYHTSTYSKWIFLPLSLGVTSIYQRNKKKKKKYYSSSVCR